jgi:hypothetical protein
MTILTKTGAEHDLMFNKLTSETGVLNKCLWLAAALGVTKIIVTITTNSGTLCCAT